MENEKITHDDTKEVMDRLIDKFAEALAEKFSDEAMQQVAEELSDESMMDVVNNLIAEAINEIKKKEPEFTATKE